MDNKPTSEVIEEIEEREKKATPGPWEGTDSQVQSGNVIVADVLTETQKSLRQMEADAAFIAHARTDIPTLLRIIGEQREALEDFMDAPTGQPDDRGLLDKQLSVDLIHTIKRLLA